MVIQFLVYLPFCIICIFINDTCINEFQVNMILLHLYFFQYQHVVINAIKSMIPNPFNLLIRVTPILMILMNFSICIYRILITNRAAILIK